MPANPRTMPSRLLSSKDTPDLEIDTSEDNIKAEMEQNLLETPSKPDQSKPAALSNTGLRILILLAFQNCGKNILMRFIMKEQPKFLHSTAVIVVELLKLSFATLYIQFYELPQTGKMSEVEEKAHCNNAFTSIYRFIRDDWKNSLLLIVPASAYSLQMSLEYVAFANIDASTFSVLVQTKMLTAAFFFWIVLKKKLCKRQMISLIILTSGVMLCSIKNNSGDKDEATDSSGDELVGILATFGIAISSGFASVYTEKVIKSARTNKVKKSLAHMQAQLAIVSLVILGIYAVSKDIGAILEKGFFYEFNSAAFLSCLNSAVGGLIVAAVLKFADSVLKGYATACSVVLTGVISSILFGTSLTIFYGIGMVNVVCAVLLYSGAGLE